MNNKTLEKLKYNELKEIVKSYCVSSLGKELIDKLKPSIDLKQVDRRLEETSEGRRLLEASYHIPLEGVSNVNPLIDKMEKGAVLDPSELIIIGDFLRGSKKIKLFIKDKEGYAKTLAAYGENITELQYIEDEINAAIKGNRINSNASKELKKIRNRIDICEGRIKEKLDKFIRNSENKECLQECFISQRNGKFTVPVKLAYKNRVDGTIIETSSKGNTVFVEPYIISKYSGELNILKAEESVEEYKILATITEMIYSQCKEIKMNIDVISEYDMIMAKAKYSKEICGTEPNEGAALAIAILEEVYKMGCITVASTHYGEIKNFSQNHPHFQNAAMEFKLDTLEPLYKLNIGKVGDSNALYISKKMGISEKIIERTREYMESKNYNYNILQDSKINKTKDTVNNVAFYKYEQGDQVFLLDSNLIGIVYEKMDRENNLIVMVDKDFIKVNYKRINLDLTAKELYPDGYDLNQLFVGYKERKLEKDIQRGSKKALKKLRKESKC